MEPRHTYPEEPPCQCPIYSLVPHRVTPVVFVELLGDHQGCFHIEIVRHCGVQPSRTPVPSSDQAGARPHLRVRRATEKFRPPARTVSPRSRRCSRKDDRRPKFVSPGTQVVDIGRTHRLYHIGRLIIRWWHPIPFKYQCPPAVGQTVRVPADCRSRRRQYGLFLGGDTAAYRADTGPKACYDVYQAWRACSGSR